MTVRNTLSEFLDSHEEPHAVAIGIGLGLAAVAGGQLSDLALASAIGAEALERKRRPKRAERQDLRNDVRREPHYFMAGLAVGAVLGLLIRGL